MSKDVHKKFVSGYSNVEYRAHRGPHGKRGGEMICLTKWGVNDETGRWEHISDGGLKSARFDAKEINDVPVAHQ